MGQLRLGDRVKVSAGISHASSKYAGKEGIIIKLAGSVVVLDIDIAGQGMYVKELTLIEVKQWDM